MPIAWLKDYRLKIYLSFSGIIFLILFATGFALLMFSNFGTMFDVTTENTIPNMLTASHLSENSALLAAYAPVLSGAENEAQLYKFSRECEQLIDKINESTDLLIFKKRTKELSEITELSRMMAQTLEGLKLETSQRLSLEKKLQRIMSKIYQLHNDLIDTISPIVYGATSLIRLSGNKASRQNVKAIKNLIDGPADRLISLLKLQALGNRLFYLAGLKATADCQAIAENMKITLTTLKAKESPAWLKAVINSVGDVINLIEGEKSIASTLEERITVFNDRIDHAVASEKAAMTSVYKSTIDVSRSSMTALMDGVIKDMEYALDIKSEGNLLMALFSATLKEESREGVANLRDRFTTSRKAFHRAVVIFNGSELALRNPILLNNVLQIKNRLDDFSDENTNPFSLRQKQIAINENIQTLLNQSREIATKMTGLINFLTGDIHSDVTTLKAKMHTKKDTSSSILLAICIGTFFICILIVIFVMKTFKNHENDLVAAKEEAESATLTKSMFLANMSHEIRTPMNSILGYLELALENQQLPDTAKGQLQTAKKSAGSLLRIINDILDLSKLENGKLAIENQPFSIYLLMDDIQQTMEQPIQEKGLQLDIDIAPDISKALLGDSFRLSQVIINLLDNAVKFTQNGRISVRVGLIKDTSELLFSIEDTGIGIPPERMDSIFDSFTQVDSSTTRRFGGTGLGTTISKELVELMGGKIWVESEEGKGSTFYFTIKTEITDRPLKDKDMSTPDKGIVSKFRQGLKILLVEDIKPNVDLTRFRLEKQGHHVTIAWNGREGVEAFESQQGFDVILMDIHMPEMNGIEAAKRIRELESGSEKNVPIIAMTAGVMKEEQEQYLSAGMNAVVSKPVDFNDLFKAIESVIPKDAGGKKELAAKDVNDATILELQSLIGVDVKKGLDSWQDSEIYKDALLIFSQDYKEVVGKLREWIKQDNLEEAYQIVHALKGVAGNLSILAVADISADIDMAIRKNQLEDIEKQMNELDFALQTVIANIQRLKANKQTAKSAEKEIDLNELTDIFYKLLAVIDQYNPYEAKPFLSKLKAVIPAEQLEPIKENLNQFDFENARQETIKLTEKLKINLNIETGNENWRLNNRD